MEREAEATERRPQKRGFQISLQNRLALTYALFISGALTALTIIVNIFTGLIFTALVKNNITQKSAEIVRAVADQYNPLSRGFDALTIEAMGMYFVHEGYIVTVEDEWENLVWDARACDMRECMTVINDIAGRMEGRFGVSGALRKERYPVSAGISGLSKTVGTVTIETYGPFFYSETETAFLAAINRLLITATVLLTFFTVVISIVLSRAIARPVNKASGAARRIAQAHVPWAGRSEAAEETPDRAAAPPVIRIDEGYHTRELAELARSINSLAAELEEGERRQKRLTSDIAHELRTPLACLQGGIEAMIDGVYKPDREHLESCHEEITRLAGLARDLNTLTSLEWESGAPYGTPALLTKTDFDLAVLLRATAEQFKAAALEKGVAIHLNLAESPLRADYDRLKQVFINLLSNAIKYTDAGSVTISIKEAERAHPPPDPGPSRNFRWEVIVADTGIGIPEDDLPRIFDRFYRTDKSRGRGTGGAGIGLTIAAAIVRAHGGTITAESPGTGEFAGQGSVFRVTL
ncbi:MAG: HAMP domain-containing histidine kinase [Treponema sp.]|jgi:signal transduction histidine kinase|nr:HAMP domain-containing histidine kinase [Treponema sp.]